MYKFDILYDHSCSIIVSRTMGVRVPGKSIGVSEGHRGKEKHHIEGTHVKRKKRVTNGNG